jgi:membrane protease YdiL (CAAX protease family)
MSTELRHALMAFGVVFLAVATLGRIDVELPVLGHLGSALVAVTLLYTPLWIAWRRSEDLVAYGFTVAPLGRGLALGLGVPLLLVFPLFTLGYVVFFDVACNVERLGALAPPGMCARFGGWAGIAAPALEASMLELAAVQLVVVALPEELFFRGLLLHLLEKALPPRRRLLGGGIGWALVISAALFAVIHLPRDWDPRSLATFFPGLLFGWMRSATGSILAPALAHASSNVFIRVLDLMVLR